MMTTYLHPTPVGLLRITGTGDGTDYGIGYSTGDGTGDGTGDDQYITGCAFADGTTLETAATTHKTPVPVGVIAQCVRELDAYFDGTLRDFTVPVKAVGTPFRQQVWTQLMKIPYGQTISYRQLAESISRPKAVRAVGGANHHNPIVIIIPCHRVVGADGSLTGYGGGLARKQFLLELEQGHRCNL